jgi:phospholipase C
VTATFTASLQSINHIIFLAQENRSFDHYFGALREYWAQNGVPDQPFDGLPQFNPAGDPNGNQTPTNPTCDPSLPFPPNSWCTIDANSQQVPSFHLQSTCLENPSPSWGEAHRSWNSADPTSSTPKLDGFVQAGANDARQHTQWLNNQNVLAPFFDTNGYRVMGYYDGTDLNYYYALATDFGTSDRWFAPVMTRTPPNREYLIGGTSHGYVNAIGSNANDLKLIPSPPIFQILQQQNPPITWKIYVDPVGTPCQSNPTSQCLYTQSYIQNFTYGRTILNTPSLLQNIVPLSQFYTDAVNGTLPQIAQIEPASSAGQDEHPSDNDPPPGQTPCCSMQSGANLVSTLINAVMCGQNNAQPSSSCTPGPSWKDSAFILTFDEPGGFYDHVPPQPAVNPDGILPVDLFPYDPCFGATAAGTICDFAYTGYRVPLVVVSPFAKKNFVSHQVRDATAILKLIESRFNLSPLTKRDAAQVGMDDPNTGFFDFNNVPWRTPPTNLPVQTRLGSSACYVDPPPTPPGF